MGRPVASVHVDIARFTLEVSRVPMADRGLWVTQLMECLALREPAAHPYGALLLQEAQEFADEQSEKKRSAAAARWGKPGKNATPESAMQGHATQGDACTPMLQTGQDRTGQTDLLSSPVAPSDRAIPDASPAHERPRNVLWDALVEAFHLNPVSKNEKTNLGRVVSTLKAKGAVPADIPLRMDRYRRTWPKVTLTLNALEKHWDLLGQPDGFEAAQDRSYTNGR